MESSPNNETKKEKELMEAGAVSKLHLAVYQGNLSKVKKLVEKDQDDAAVNKPDKFGQTPLHIACHKGRVDCLKFLASQRGADLTVADAAGNSLLHAAGGSGSGEIVSFLLEKGLSVNTRNEEGFTPSHVCQMHCPKDKIQMVLGIMEGEVKMEEGSGGNRGRWGGGVDHTISPVSSRSSPSDNPTINSSPKEDSHNRADQELYLAIFHGDIAKVKSFVDRGDPSILSRRDKYGQTPLHFACYKGSKEMTRLLVEGGSDLEASDINGNTAAHAAACSSPAVLAYLIEQGVDVDSPNLEGNVPVEICRQHCPAYAKEHMLHLLKEASLVRHKVELAVQRQSAMQVVYQQLSVLRSSLSMGLREDVQSVLSSPAKAPPKRDSNRSLGSSTTSDKSIDVNHALLTLVEANMQIVEGQSLYLQTLENSTVRLERMFRKLDSRLDAMEAARQRP